MFTVILSSGVKQGDMFSSVLYDVYMDDLSCALIRSNIRRFIGDKIVNH